MEVDIFDFLAVLDVEARVSRNDVLAPSKSLRAKSISSASVAKRSDRVSTSALIIGSSWLPGDIEQMSRWRGPSKKAAASLNVQNRSESAFGVGGTQDVGIPYLCRQSSRRDGIAVVRPPALVGGQWQHRAWRWGVDPSTGGSPAQFTKVDITLSHPFGHGSAQCPAAR